MTEVPTIEELMNPLIAALRDLGGSGSIEEIYERVVQNLRLPEEALSVLHPGAGNQTEVQNRLAWARTYLKRYGALANSSRGIWSLANPESELSVDPKEVIKAPRGDVKRRKLTVGSAKTLNETPGGAQDLEEPEEASTWRAQLYQILTEQVDPSAFERLIQRLLRESGFVQVDVTGRTGDGGIDGKGIARIHGFMSFHVVFQCKRYQGIVSSSHIRDFRGAMVGRADKGLFITTGTFSRDAVKEASRDGAPPIDLVDGDQLADKLKELRLGITTELTETVSIDKNWFSQL